MVDAEKVLLLKAMKSQYRTLVNRNQELNQKLIDVNRATRVLMKEGNDLMRKMGEDDPFFFQAYVTGVVSLPEKWFTEEVTENGS